MLDVPFWRQKLHIRYWNNPMVLRKTLALQTGGLASDYMPKREEALKDGEGD